MFLKVLVPVVGAAVVASALTGCNVGMAPAGGSDAEVKAFFDKQPLDVRAKQTMASPAPYDFKIKKIKEMYQKEGKEVPAEYLQGNHTAH